MWKEVRVEGIWIKAFKSLKKFRGGGWSPSENSVCSCPLFQFLQFLQFISFYVGGMGREARQLHFLF